MTLSRLTITPDSALCALAALFFGLGSLNVPVAVAGTASGLAEALAHACALALLALSALCLPLFPAAASILFHAGAALPEAAGLALCAALHQNARAAGRAGETARMAGLFLVLTLAAVNLDWRAGLEFMRLPLPWAGDFGPALPGLAIALSLGAALYREGKRKDATGPDIDRNHTEEEPATPPPVIKNPAAVTVPYCPLPSHSGQPVQPQKS